MINFSDFSIYVTLIINTFKIYFWAFQIKIDLLLTFFNDTGTWGIGTNKYCLLCQPWKSGAFSELVWQRRLEIISSLNNACTNTIVHTNHEFYATIKRIATEGCHGIRENLVGSSRHWIDFVSVRLIEASTNSWTMIGVISTHD